MAGTLLLGVVGIIFLTFGILIIRADNAAEKNQIQTEDISMNTAQIDDPLRYEFNSAEEYEDYDTWFRAKVQEALDSDKPAIPHDEVFARLESKLSEKLKNAR